MSEASPLRMLWGSPVLFAQPVKHPELLQHVVPDHVQNALLAAMLAISAAEANIILPSFLSLTVNLLRSGKPASLCHYSAWQTTQAHHRACSITLVHHRRSSMSSFKTR